MAVVRTRGSVGESWQERKERKERNIEGKVSVDTGVEDD